jgi:cytochrome c-type biogenesis protein CcmH/NrfF
MIAESKARMVASMVQKTRQAQREGKLNQAIVKKLKNAK